jgi:YVTN family beta-propeller protein
MRPLALLLASIPLVSGAALQDPAPHRSPRDVALSEDGRWALTANSGSDTVSLVDLGRGTVAAEVPVGRRPFALAWRGSVAAVSNLLDDSITILEAAPPRLTVRAAIPVGDEPRGVALSPDGRRAFVALAGEDAVATVDLSTRQVTARIPVGDEPWHLALTPDGARLAVGENLSRSVRVLDAADGRTLYAVDLRGPNVRQLAVSPDGAWAYVPNLAERGSPVTRQNIDRGWVIAARLSRVPLRQEGPRAAIALDPRGQAVGDVEGVALRPDGQALALAAGGTHEILLLRLPLPFVAFGGPGDHIEPDLLKDARRFRRVPVGGRPVACAFTPDGASVVVADFLADALHLLDFEAGRVARTIRLGGRAEPSPTRRGEAIFYDAGRSFHQWFSCHTCHTDGHTNGSSYDTLNDGNYGRAKKTLSLRGAARTGPWTWHGWQPELRAALAHSMKTTMQGPEPTAEDLDALEAFVRTLDFPPAAAPRSEAARRGEALFRDRACDTCHAPPDYTSPETYLVGLEDLHDAYKGFNPPPLRGVGTRGPYLHDGRARTLEEVLQKHHRPSRLNGRPDFTPEELADLVTFLKSL